MIETIVVGLNVGVLARLIMAGKQNIGVCQRSLKIDPLRFGEFKPQRVSFQEASTASS